jgi:signal transduction histidine kinase
MITARKKGNIISPTIIGIVSLIITLIALGAASRLLYLETVSLLTDNLREKILVISTTAAANINAEDLMQLQKPAWNTVVNNLHRVKYSNDDIVFMYIFRKTSSDPAQMEFVADADSINPYANAYKDKLNNIDVNRDGIIEPDGPDKLQWPGQPYVEAVDIPETFAAYDSPLTSTDLYSDEYGTVLTGYAPIKDSHGNTVAVLASDIKADKFFSVTTQTLKPFIYFILVLSVIITVLVLVIIYTSNRYRHYLEKSKTKIEDLVVVLQQANERLQFIDQQKSEFVSIASHQLRSPLTAIRGYISMVLEGSYGQIPDKSKEPLERVSESAKFMALSINDFLDVSRIESGNMKYDYGDIDVREQAEHIVDDLRADALKRGLLLMFRSNMTGAGTVHADGGKTQQILHNLINNALKYTLKGAVTVYAHDDIKSKKMYIEIIDTGLGMSQETIEKLFAKFSRAKIASSANIMGTGLGLFVAREMARAMGGDIVCSSEGEGRGSNFTITLPLV